MTHTAPAGQTQEFQPDGIYLDTPTYGLPPLSTVDALGDAVERWQRGTATMAEYDGAVDRSREIYADLVSTDLANVAIANQVSVFVGVIAASLPEGAKVVVPEGEFTSVLFPMLIQAERGIQVVEAPLDGVTDVIDDSTRLVAFSLVRSNDGTVAPVDEIEAAARRAGALTLADITQAVGWMPVDATRFDFTVASAYKWLLCPRGTAFMTIAPERQEETSPILAGWYAGEDVWKSIYGAPLRLADDARRFDVSPAWLAWMGTVPSLESIASRGIENIHRHNLELANTVRARIGDPAGNSTILTVPTDDPAALARAGIRSSVRSGAVRVGFHFYNTMDDAEALLSTITDGHPQG